MQESIDIVVKVIPETETYFPVYSPQAVQTGFLQLQNSYLLQTDNASRIILARVGR